MTALNQADAIRIKASAALDPDTKNSLGQFFTNAPISQFMASLFSNVQGDMTLLDPGCGSGLLTAAFISEACRRGQSRSIEVYAYDLEQRMKPFIDETFSISTASAKQEKLSVKTRFFLEDYIQTAKSGEQPLRDKKFTHCIMNPPYKKIASSSMHKKILSSIGIDVVNLYAGFVALAIQQLQEGGELVAIIPRSFCNGAYYQPFRKFILQHAAIKHIHIFDSRGNVFSDEQVLQENIIIHLVKGARQGKVKITSSATADFAFDEEGQTVAASDMAVRTVSFNKIVSQKDKEFFIHIAANQRDQAIIERLSYFTATLDELNVAVSTGPVVDFRLKSDLRQELEEGAAPLIYPIHLNGGIHWPKNSKKPNAIAISENSKSSLWENKDYYVLVRRFSSKEQRRRIVASMYDGGLPSNFIGFENRLNVFHENKKGIDEYLAKGLYVYLNSTLLDKYYRLFGGHTQVNATDLKNIHYPNAESLKNIGKQINEKVVTQKEIDDLIDKEISRMAKDNGNDNPLHLDEKINQALELLNELGMPRAQQNERSALTLLALLNLAPHSSWQDIESPLIGVTPIMDWVRDIYGKQYAPNTRETFRRQTLHQFVDAGIALYNPDEPSRPVNSPKACYQITPELREILTTYNTLKWEKSIAGWFTQRTSLVAKYAMAREMHMIPLTLTDGSEIKLSAGEHSQLIYDIVTKFGPQFAPSSEVIYLGDTGAKELTFNKERLKELGVTLNRKGKLPDVVLYWAERDWLLLIESVTSHGPVDGKRHNELAELFKNTKSGLVYVTAFPDRRTMKEHFVPSYHRLTLFTYTPDELHRAFYSLTHYVVVLDYKSL